MIKNKIEFNFHINFSKLLDNTNYLFGSIYSKNKQNDTYVLFEEEKYIFKLNNNFEIINNYYVSNNVWTNLIYYNDNNFIFKNQDNENINYFNLNNKIINIPLLSKMKDYSIYNDKLFIFNIKNLDNNYYIYDNSLNELNEVINKNEILNNYKYNSLINDNIESKLDNEFIINYFQFNDSIIVFTSNYINELNTESKTYILKLDNNFNILVKKEFCNKGNFYNAYFYNNYYYISYMLPKNRIVILKYDSNIELIEEEKISSYRSEFITINNKLCLIADEPKRYDKDLKKYKNQELIGNSTLFILE